MSWRPLPSLKSNELPPEVHQKTRFLIDESLGPGVARYLRDAGFNSTFVGDVGLTGRSDEDVFAYAWAEKRMLWTHDRDFLDDTRFPEHRNPGVVILPGGSGNQTHMSTGISTALQVFSVAPKIWQKSKTVITPNGEITIRNRDAGTGKVTTSRYRLSRNGDVEIWEE